ncbi:MULTISPECIES: hypothetical protein [Streptomyces]|uniref:Uncharacterized protein n=2 Tax=Streptomyces TaxID=1883 RepID=A0ABU2REM6_9ACTN|nr:MULTISPECIES: hypothetical protein [unclassified Streptomyces]MBK3592475.1 hypothetical protein [Streptomyces sp. MBT51]MDT0427313.1 hypothetical protein [Streptomyces sp. DSM 41770]
MSTSALAAQGTLYVYDQAYENPSGCYAVEDALVIVRNDTDEIAYFFDEPGCEGGLVEVVQPDTTSPVIGAQSFSIG